MSHVCDGRWHDSGEDGVGCAGRGPATTRRALRRAQLGVDGQVAAVTRGVESLEGEQVRSRNQERRGILDPLLFKRLSGFMALRDAVEWNLAGPNMESRHLAAVDPGDAAVIHTHAEQERGRQLAVHDKRVPQKDRRVTALHVREHGAIIAVLITDRSLPGVPGGVLDEVTASPQFGRLRRFIGALAPAPASRLRRKEDRSRRDRRDSGKPRAPPRRGIGGRQLRMDAFQRRARAIRRCGPRKTDAVTHFVHDLLTRVAQGQFLPAVAQFAGQRSERLEAKLRGKGFNVLRHHHEVVTPDGGVRGERKFVEGPAFETNVCRRCVVQLDKLQRPLVRRVEMNLVDDHWRGGSVGEGDGGAGRRK